LFRGKTPIRGNIIDVYWLYDDGGLTLLLPFILQVGSGNTLPIEVQSYSKAPIVLALNWRMFEQGILKGKVSLYS
jgi:Solute carrier family 12